MLRASRTTEDPGLREKYGDVPRAPIQLVACPMNKGVNHGGVLRVAEAFRLEEVIFEPEIDGSVDLSGRRGAGESQPWRWETALDAIEQAKLRGRRIYALTLSEGSTPLTDVEWRFPCAIILGSEADGIPPAVVVQSDESIAIPLYGLTTSLNVATAAAIVVHECVRRYCEIDPSFQPVRRASRALLGLPPADYTGSQPQDV